MSVLIADDHAPVRRTLRDLLQDSGLQVVGEAANGNEAVQLCEHLRPQIIVLDISMPVLNGFEAARKIVEISPVTKIIFLTGHILQEYVDEARRIGALGFVFKRDAAGGLLKAITAALAGETYVSGPSAARPVC